MYGRQMSRLTANFQIWKQRRHFMMTESGCEFVKTMKASEIHSLLMTNMLLMRPAATGYLTAVLEKLGGGGVHRI